MPKIYFKIEDNVLIKEIPCGENICRSEIVIDKETFIKCYNAWIDAPEDNEDQ